MSAYVNSGDLFDNESLDQITTYPEWSSEQLEKSRQAMEELWEKRSVIVNEGLDRRQTGYHWTSYVLRRLGFCYSVAERTPSESEDVRPDFTLFFDSGDFHTARQERGTRDFFTNAIGVVRSIGWSESMDELEEVEEGEHSNPAYELDRYMRLTNVRWGVLTNGRLWRLYHRDTSGLLNTFYEVDLLAALEGDNAEVFKYFWLVFSPMGLGGTKQGDAIVDRLYD